MKKSSIKKTTKKSKTVVVKTGSVDAFFSIARSIMRAADKGEVIEKRPTTLSFADPSEMLRFLSEAKLKLIDNIRQHPDSITNIAKAMGRNRAAVYRDIHQMETFGLVETHEECNPGHGRHKIVQLTAPLFKLEAYI